MAETSPTPTHPPARVEHRILVPADVSMVELLGLRDEVLRALAAHTASRLTGA